MQTTCMYNTHAHRAYTPHVHTLMQTHPYTMSLYTYTLMHTHMFKPPWYTCIHTGTLKSTPFLKVTFAFFRSGSYTEQNRWTTSLYSLRISPLGF